MSSKVHVLGKDGAIAKASEEQAKALPTHLIKALRTREIPMVTRKWREKRKIKGIHQDSSEIPKAESTFSKHLTHHTPKSKGQVKWIKTDTSKLKIEPIKRVDKRLVQKSPLGSEKDSCNPDEPFENSTATSVLDEPLIQGLETRYTYDEYANLMFSQPLPDTQDSPIVISQPEKSLIEPLPSPTPPEEPDQKQLEESRKFLSTPSGPRASPMELLIAEKIYPGIKWTTNTLWEVANMIAPLFENHDAKTFMPFQHRQKVISDEMYAMYDIPRENIVEHDAQEMTPQIAPVAESIYRPSAPTEPTYSSTRSTEKEDLPEIQQKARVEANPHVYEMPPTYYPYMKKLAPSIPNPRQNAATLGPKHYVDFFGVEQPTKPPKAPHAMIPKISHKSKASMTPYQAEQLMKATKEMNRHKIPLQVTQLKKLHLIQPNYRSQIVSRGSMDRVTGSVMGECLEGTRNTHQSLSEPDNSGE